MRCHPDFIGGFLKYTENSESSEKLRLWAATATVAAALERKCYMTWGHTTLFPNLYIIIVAPSGARKGEPMVVARDLMSAADVILSAERITDEALLKFLAESQNIFKDPDSGRHVEHCSVTVIGEELSVLLRNKDISFMADLTALYDCRDNWKYQTKGSGTDEIKGGCLNLLVSTAPDWLPTILPPEAVGGGFTSRCFFVVESLKGKTVADPNLAMPDPEKRRRLLADLEQVKVMAGAFNLSKEAYDFYINWYETQEADLAKGILPVQDPKLANYVSRRATHIKKLGMVLSASRSDSRIVERTDLERALSMMLSIEENMGDAFKTIGHSKNAAVLEQVIDVLRARKSITKRELLRLVQRDLDFTEFAQIERALEEMGYIQRVISGKSTIFKFTG